MIILDPKRTLLGFPFHDEKARLVLSGSIIGPAREEVFNRLEHLAADLTSEVEASDAGSPDSHSEITVRIRKILESAAFDSFSLYKDGSVLLQEGKKRPILFTGAEGLKIIPVFHDRILEKRDEMDELLRHCSEPFDEA